MTKTLAKDEAGKLARLRDELVDEIDNAWAGLKASFEQLKRQWYYKLGELFIRLRTTFEKGRGGDVAFAAFCKKHWPKISEPQRCEYMAYRKKLGPISTSISRKIELPPLREVTYPEHRKKHIEQERNKSEYRRIAEAAPSNASEDDDEKVYELAQKIVSTGFKVLAVKLHPDKDGGDNVAMRRLNEARKFLQQAMLRAASFFLNNS